MMSFAAAEPAKSDFIMEYEMLKTLFLTALLSAISLPVLADDMASHDGMTADVTVGDLTISNAWMRATTSVARSSGGFLTIQNEGTADDRLLSASADFSMVQLHQTVTVEGVNRMQEQADGILIPAGQSVSLMPGGYHIMFMGLEEGVPMGSTREVTLVFESAGKVSVVLPAQMGGPAMDHGAMPDHGGMSGHDAHGDQ